MECFLFTHLCVVATHFPYIYIYAHIIGKSYKHLLFVSSVFSPFSSFMQCFFDVLSKGNVCIIRYTYKLFGVDVTGCICIRLIAPVGWPNSMYLVFLFDISFNMHVLGMCMFIIFNNRFSLCVENKLKLE